LSTAHHHTLPVVVPVYNEAANIGATLEAVAAEIKSSGRFEAAIVVVDDGSTDGTAEAARAAQTGIDTTVISQPNSGRMAARRRGLAAATGDYVLFLDSRVRILPGSLGFAAAALDRGDTVWTADVRIDAVGNPYGLFWNVLTEMAWAAYFDNPRTTSFTDIEFDHYPKGTTCLLAPSAVLGQAFAEFQTAYRDERYANDDTPLLRWIAARQPIHVSPEYGARYQPRTNLRAFLRHSHHRGIVFVDGHGRRESRFFTAVVAFYPLSLLAVGVVLKRPRWAVAGVGLSVAAAALLAATKHRRRDEVVAFAGLTPIYAAAHGLGMWRGLWLAIRARR
jgi:glycosyltransferase involved in cell wall biosynthesis